MLVHAGYQHPQTQPGKWCFSSRSSNVSGGHTSHHTVKALLRALAGDLASDPAGGFEYVQGVLGSQLKYNPGNYLGNHCTLRCILKELKGGKS